MGYHLTEIKNQVSMKTQLTWDKKVSFDLLVG